MQVLLLLLLLLLLLRHICSACAKISHNLCQVLTLWQFDAQADIMQVLLLLRQMESTNTQATASKVSLLMLGQQAVIDAYLCLLHLTTGKIVF